MRRLTGLSLIVVVILFITSVPRATRAVEAGGSWALLVGVDDYIQAESLQFCGADQTALSERLVTSGFSREQVFLLHDAAENRKYLPFKVNIEKQLDLILSLVEEQDLVIVSLSGHGVHIDGKSYFCPTDANIDDPATLISLDAIYKKFETCAASLRILIVDACRNEPRLPGKRATNKTSRQDEARAFARTLEKPPEGIVLLNSCTAGEVSYEDSGFGHGVFMHYLLEGFDGRADADGNGRISLNELSRYTNTKTKSYVARKFNDSQRPFLKGDLTLDVLDFEFANALRITNSLEMKLVLIPSGEFLMGGTENLQELTDANYYIPENFTNDDELPQHRVKITKPFYLGQTEVTVGQFRKFVEDKSYRTELEREDAEGMGYNAEAQGTEQKTEYNWTNTGFEQTDDHPVVNVSWNDAIAFCRWLSKKEKATYRLPSEAEWEYACRAGTTTRYSTGDTNDSLKGTSTNWDVSASKKFMNVVAFGVFEFDDGWPFTAPVDRFIENPFGLHGMHGNVSEWCLDGYDENYYRNCPVADPVYTKAAEHKTLRGGSWDSFPVYCRSAMRFAATADYTSMMTGFRVARVPSVK